MNPLVRSSCSSSVLLVSSKTATSPRLGRRTAANRRNIASSASRCSYIGSTPIPVPPGITLERVVASRPSSNDANSATRSSRRGNNSGVDERLIIRGKNGETSIKVYNFMRFLLPNTNATGSLSPSPNGSEATQEQEGSRELKVKRRNPPCPPTAIADPFSFTATPTASSSSASTAAPESNAITLFVESPAEKQQRMTWGLTRTLIANAIAGQSNGYTLPIYLIGVGYRAALEMDRASESEAASAGSTVVSTPVISTVSKEAYPRRRLILRLGYSHVIYVPVPQDLKVTVHSPTIIFVWGRDKQRVGQFCADVRALRKPEVYKGKGVFVGDEKIKMKVGKKK